MHRLAEFFIIIIGIFWKYVCKKVKLLYEKFDCNIQCYKIKFCNFQLAVESVDYMVFTLLYLLYFYRKIKYRKIMQQKLNYYCKILACTVHF